MNWYDYIGQPDYQQADDKERERLRNNYWSQYVEPHVPMEQYLDTRSAFDRGVLGVFLKWLVENNACVVMS